MLAYGKIYENHYSHCKTKTFQDLHELFWFIWQTQFILFLKSESKCKNKIQKSISFPFNIAVFQYFILYSCFVQSYTFVTHSDCL